MSDIDIDKVRKARLEAKRAAMVRWANDLNIEIRLSWPSGFLGWFMALTLLVAPVGLVIFSIWLAKKGLDRRG